MMSAVTQYVKPPDSSPLKKNVVSIEDTSNLNFTLPVDNMNIFPSEIKPLTMTSSSIIPEKKKPTESSIIESRFHLPLLKGVASIPIYERLNELQHQSKVSSMDYMEINPELVAKQTAINDKVRSLLKNSIRTKQKPIDIVPDFIDLSGVSETIKKQRVQSVITDNVNIMESSLKEQCCTSQHPEAVIITGSPILKQSSDSNNKSKTALYSSPSSDNSSEEVQVIVPITHFKSSSSTLSPKFTETNDSYAPVSVHLKNELSPKTPSHLQQSGQPPWFIFLNNYPTDSLLNDTVHLQTHDAISNGLQGSLNNQLDFFGNLHEEICALLLWLDPTPEELLLRQRVLARVTIIAQTLWPNCTVQSFGSYYTGLWLPNGDMDICIMNVNGDQVSNLRVLTVCLTRLGIPLAVEIISSARVPIVKFVDSESGIPVDISLNTESAISTSDYVVEQLKLFPWLRPLILLMKLYLQQRNLGETYRGGVGSYLLFVLCLSFLQQHRISTTRSLIPVIGLGHLLFDFLQLYGRDFNFDTTAISVRKGGSYFPKTQNNWFNYDKPSLLAVESPLAIEMDIGRNSYDIRTVRNCFRQSFLTLTELLYEWESGRYNKNESILQHLIFSTDSLMINRIRYPLNLSGNTTLEKSSWWNAVKGYFNQPVAAIRPCPILPEQVIEQVYNDLEQAGKSISGSIDTVTQQLWGKKRSLSTKQRSAERRHHHQTSIIHNETKQSSSVSNQPSSNPFVFNRTCMDNGLDTYKRKKKNIKINNDKLSNKISPSIIQLSEKNISYLNNQKQQFYEKWD